MYTCIDGLYRICRGYYGSYSNPVLQLYTDPTDEAKVDKYLYKCETINCDDQLEKACLIISKKNINLSLT